MSARTLVQVLAVFTVLLVLGCLATLAAVRLRPPAEPTFVASRWRDGKLAGRAVTHSAGSALDETEGTLVFEEITGEGWLPRFSETLLSIGLAPARDGVRVELEGKSVYITPDDLLVRQAYDHGMGFDAAGLTIGVDMPVVVAMAAERLQKNPLVVRDHASFHRVRTRRIVPGSLPDVPADASTFSDAHATRFVLAAGRYLAQGVTDNGRFRYMVNAPTNQTMSGYDWPRHAGATYFLAQASALASKLGEPDAADMKRAALRAANLLRGPALVRCGSHACIGDGDPLEVGSVALTILAFVEIVTNQTDVTFTGLVRELADLLLAQQRTDGEFMHQLGRDGHPIDVQLPYFSGEAALALARAHALTGDARYLEGARKSVAYLVGPAWSFFGNRYYFAEEHWTCQATGELWDRAPDAKALDFCLRWQAFTRSIQHKGAECAFDCDGGLGVGPIITPRLTPVASRCEAGVATLDAATRAGSNPAELERLREQLRRSLALLYRQQFHGQLEHLMASPDAVRGAMPGSEVDWQLRIDYAQHAGSAMLRYLHLPK